MSDKKKYRVTVCGRIYDTFVVEASSEDEACDLVYGDWEPTATHTDWALEDCDVYYCEEVKEPRDER